MTFILYMHWTAYLLFLFLPIWQQIQKSRVEQTKQTEIKIFKNKGVRNQQQGQTLVTIVALVFLKTFWCDFRVVSWQAIDVKYSHLYGLLRLCDRSNQLNRSQILNLSFLWESVHIRLDRSQSDLSSHSSVHIQIAFNLDRSQIDLTHWCEWPRSQTRHC